MNVRQRIRQTDTYEKLKQRSDPLLLAVSGGPDSTAMLHLFASHLKIGETRDLYAAYVKHDLREHGPEQDRAFVRDVARQLEVPFLSRTVEVQSEIENTSVSPEEAARRRRYEALRDMCSETKARTVLTAHHQDDQIETVLLRLLEGTGIQGLRCIRKQRPLTENPEKNGSGDEVQLYRPLLDVSKKKLREFLEKHGHSWRVDPSNQQMHLRRNFVREQLKPIVKERLGSSYPNLLLRIRKRAAEVDETLRTQWEAKQISGRLREDALIVKREKVKDLSPLFYPYFLRWIKRKLCLDKIGVRSHDFDRIQRLLSSDVTGREEVLSDDVCVRMEHEYVVASRNGKKKTSRLSVEGRKRLTFPGCTSWGKFQIMVQPIRNIQRSLNETCDTPWKEVVDISRVIGPISVTKRRQGDDIRPYGFSGHKKISDLMIDRKVPASEREHWPILRDQRGVVWVSGLRLSHRICLTDRTRRKNAFLIYCRRMDESVQLESK